MATKQTKITGDGDRVEPEKVTSKQKKEQVAIEEGKQAIVTAKKLLASAQAARRKYDWEWLVRNLYLRGYHFARYNSSNSTFTMGTKTKVRIPINLMWAQARAIRNQVTSFRPKWEALPNKPTEAAKENAQYSEKELDYLYRKLNLKRKMKEIIYHGLYTSVGIWQFDWDKRGDGGQGEVEISVVDPFDFFIDPNATNFEDAQYCIKAVRKPLQEIKTDPRYKNTAEIKADKKLAASEYKSFLLQAIKNPEEESGNLEDANEYTILYELQKKEYQEDGQVKIKILSFTEDSILPLRDELTENDTINYELFQADLQPLEVYGESWAKQVMPINRVLDALESHIFEYNHFFAKGRFVIDKGSGVRSVINENGQIIEKNPGYTVTSLPIAPLPMSTFQQIANFRQYLEDIGGLHEVSLGRIPAGVKSGVGIAELRQADATSQDDLVDALEDFLVRASKQIFRIISKNYTTAKLAKVSGKGGEPEYFYVLGSESPTAKSLQKKNRNTFGQMNLPIAVIGADTEVRVMIGSWLAYTKQARQEELKELFRLGAIDQKTLLQHLEFGDVDSITDRTRTERLVQLRQSQPMAQEMLAARKGVDDESLALAENELMDEGKPEPVEMEDDHELHLIVHREGMAKTKYPSIYLDHMSEHIKLMEAAPATGAGTAAATMAAMMGGGQGAPGEGAPLDLEAMMGGGGGTAPTAPPLQPAIAGPGVPGAVPTPPTTIGQ
jgi:hypothetical protein